MFIFEIEEVLILAKILVAGKVPEIGLQLLKEHDVEMYDGEELISAQELTKRVQDKDAFIKFVVYESDKRGH